jgi:L-alanine-DL-glutamate epimerase-like enolase superfamily enzyme
MHLSYWRFDLLLKDRWTIANATSPGAPTGKQVTPVVFVELTDGIGGKGRGEASPSSQYGETHSTVTRFLEKVDARQLRFDDIPGSMAYLEHITPASSPAKCAINLALVDGAARAAGVSAGDFLGLPFEEGRHVTSFSIGLDEPSEMARKAAEAINRPILKLKVGTSHDRENFAAVRSEALGKPIRVDANGAWKSREEALENIEWFSGVGGVEFVEQPMPAFAPNADWIWLKERSPLPIFGDESYQGVLDVDRCADCVHGVNVKLVKTAGISGAVEALRAARARGLKTMLGCMIESSLLISAAAHLASLTDYLDLDGNLLITNDPYKGVRTDGGLMTFVGVENRVGLRVLERGRSVTGVGRG